VTWQNDYVSVPERLRAFWEQHPYGRVVTELVWADHELRDYIVRAEIYFGSELRNDPPTATGLAHDCAADLQPNMRASALEVCETSAIGRALANANYAAKPTKTAGGSGDGAAHPPESPASTSVGADGNGEGPDAPADELAALVALYGSQAKALVAARRLWDVTSVAQLAPAQIEELARVKR
jgi:hypothetical protein